MVANTCNSITWEAEIGGSLRRSQPELHSNNMPQKKIKLKTNLKMKYGKVMEENRQDGVVMTKMENSELKNIQ